MQNLSDLFHDAATFIAVEPEDSGAIFLEAAQMARAPHHVETPWPIFLVPASPYPSSGSWNSPEWPGHLETSVRFAREEAIGWLRREGLVMNGLSGTAGGPGKLVFTRRGLSLRNRADVALFRQASALPVALVHPAIEKRVIPQFLRGDRDSAVAYAFRAVEIAVRRTAGFGGGKHGMAMMREVFRPAIEKKPVGNAGPLTDRSLPQGEQEAEQSLFAGAIGHGRNPISHREVDMGPVEAARLILLASHLLSIVEARIHGRAAESGNSTPPPARPPREG